MPERLDGSAKHGFARRAAREAIAPRAIVVVATLTALWLRVDAAGLGAGLYGDNAYLVGLAFGTFLAVSPLWWVYVALRGAASVLVTPATANTFKAWGVAALTAPFVLATGLFLLPRQTFDPAPAA